MLAEAAPARLRSDTVVLGGAVDGGDLVDAILVAVDVEGTECVGPGAPVDLYYSYVSDGIFLDV